MMRWSTGDFLGRETILYDIVMVDTGYYTVVKTHRPVQHKRGPSVNNGL